MEFKLGQIISYAFQHFTDDRKYSIDGRLILCFLQLSLVVDFKNLDSDFKEKIKISQRIIYTPTGPYYNSSNFYSRYRIVSFENDITLITTLPGRKIHVVYIYDLRTTSIFPFKVFKNSRYYANYDLSSVKQNNISLGGGWIYTKFNIRMNYLQNVLDQDRTLKTVIYTYPEYKKTADIDSKIFLDGDMTKQVSIYDVDKENLFDITNYLYPKIKLKFGPEVNLEESYFMLRSFSNQNFGAWKQSVQISLEDVLVNRWWNVMIYYVIISLFVLVTIGCLCLHRIIKRWS